MWTPTLDRPRPPPFSLLASEPVRAGVEWAACVSSPWLALAPRGDDHPVLVLPGLFATDAYMAPMRRFLRAKGFDPRPWKGGRNMGRWDALEATVLPAVWQLSDEAGQPVSLVGASMGGVYAREAARREPDRVRCVVTLSSPASGPHRANHVWPWFELFSGQPAEAASAPPPPVPSTSIYTRSDGLLAWQPCLQGAAPQAENIEIVSSHLGLAWNPLALYIVADRLAQARGAWRPFMSGSTFDDPVVPDPQAARARSP
jgi:pimeloyl-ACP methyl ester carboxylesterase